MKHFAEKLFKRNYTKRMLAILIAAVVLFAAVAVLIPVTLHKQIAEFRVLEEAREHHEESDVQPDEAAVPSEREHDGKKQELKAILRQLSPIGSGTKIAFAVVAFLAFLLGAFYWITVAEWLYKTAVLNGLNRALWPMLGLLFNILIIPLLLIVLCDPKRNRKQVP